MSVSQQLVLNTFEVFIAKTICVTIVVSVNPCTWVSKHLVTSVVLFHQAPLVLGVNVT